MSSINIETLLEPVAGDNPCGEDLSDLTEYYVLEDLATGKEEDGFGGEAQEPQWPQVIDLATELLAQGKELRVVVLLAHALVAREGADGLRDGLQLLRRMLEQYWDGLYPELDPDDDAPAMARVNMLPDLTSEAGVFSRLVRGIPLTASRQLGKYSWRDIQIARGEISVSEEDKAPGLDVIEAAFRDTPPEDTQALCGYLQGAAESVEATDQFLSEKVGPGNAAGLSNLSSLLRRILTHVQGSAAGEDMPGDQSVAGADATAPDGAAPRAPQAGVGEIRSQDDVRRALDRICSWYEQNEPSSPLPLMLRRAQKLIGKNFREIVRDIANNAESQIDELFGPEEEASDE